MQKKSNKTWYCELHRNEFTNVCIGCLDDIFHKGLGVKREVIGGLVDEWEDTLGYIEEL